MFIKETFKYWYQRCVLKIQYESGSTSNRNRFMSVGKLNHSQSCKQVNTFTGRQHVITVWPQQVCVCVCVACVCGAAGLTLGTWGLNSTARWMASTAFISAVLNPRLDAASGENLHARTHKYSCQYSDLGLHFTIWSKWVWKWLPRCQIKTLKSRLLTCH